MRRAMGKVAVGALLALGTVTIATLPATAQPPEHAKPTLSSTLPIVVHGQHVVGDYASGVGHDLLGWPPNGGVVGEATGGEGAVVPGGPGPGFHFPNGFAPGASFCLAQSESPGFHPGLG